MENELERRLGSPDGFGDAVAIDVSAVATNAFGEGEYEVRLTYPPDSDTPYGRDVVGRLRREIEDALPRAWVVGFALPSRRSGDNDVVVTVDYVPEGALQPS